MGGSHCEWFYDKGNSQSFCKYHFNVRQFKKLYNVTLFLLIKIKNVALCGETWVLVVLLSSFVPRFILCNVDIKKNITVLRFYLHKNMLTVIRPWLWCGSIVRIASQLTLSNWEWVWLGDNSLWLWIVYDDSFKILEIMKYLNVTLYSHGPYLTVSHYLSGFK